MFVLGLAAVLVIIVIIIGLILTLLVVGKGDADYDKNSKKNVTKLSTIYIVTILASLIAFVVFMVRFFA